MSRRPPPAPFRGRLLATPGAGRVVVLTVPLLLPWTLVLSDGAVSIVFSWGLVSAWPLPVHTVSLPRYLGYVTAGLPAYLQAWPYSTVLYACALASTSSHVRRTGLVDDQGTAAFLALAGMTHLLVSVGLWRTGRTALPFGTVVLLTLAYAVYGSEESETRDER